MKEAPQPSSPSSWKLVLPKEDLGLKESLGSSKNFSFSCFTETPSGLDLAPLCGVNINITTLHSKSLLQHSRWSYFLCLIMLWRKSI